MSKHQITYQSGEVHPVAPSEQTQRSNRCVIFMEGQRVPVMGFYQFAPGQPQEWRGWTDCVGMPIRRVLWWFEIPPTPTHEPNYSGANAPIEKWAQMGVSDEH